MTINKRMRIRLTVYATVIAVVALFLLYFKYLPRVISLEKHRPEIEKAIKDNINLPVTFGKLHTSVTWNFGVRIELSNVNIKHADKSDFISTGPVEVELSIPAFLKKQVLIREIDVDYTLAHITRYKNGSFDIEQLIPKKKKAGKYKFILKKSTIKVSGYQIYFTDHYVKPVQSITVVGKNIKIFDFSPDKYIKIYANGEILSKKKTNTKFNINIKSQLPLIKRNLLNRTFAINGSIQNIYPGTYLSYINHYIDNKFIDLTGLANIQFDINRTDADNSIYNFRIESSIKKLYGNKKVKGDVFNIKEESRILLDGSVDNSKKQVLSFNNAEFINHKSNVKLTGKIYNFKTPKRNLDLKVKVNNTRIEALADVFPKEIKVPKDVFNKLKRNNIRGNIDAELVLKGYYRVPQMFGNVKYNDFSIDDTTNIPKSHGTVVFKGYYLDLDTLTYVNPGEYITLTGSLSPVKYKTYNLKIKSNNINIEKADKMLLAIRNILEFKLGPVPLMKLKGRGQISLSIKGKFKTPSLNGYIDVKNGYVSYKLLAKYAHDVNGKLLFSNDRILYNKISGIVKNSKVIGEGYSTLRQDSFSDVKLTLPNMDLKVGQEFVNASPLLVKVKESLKNIESAHGKADGMVNLKGTKDYLYSNGSFILNNADVKYLGFSEIFRNLAGTVKYDDEKTYLENIKGIVAKSPVTVNGTVDRKQNIKLLLTSDRVNLAEGRKLIKNSPILVETEVALRDYPLFSGNSKAELSLSGYLPDKKVFDYVKFNDFKASFFNKIYGYPVNVSGNQVIFTMDAMYTKRMNALTLDTPMTVSGKITGFSAKTPAPNLNFNVPKFELSKIHELNKSKLMPNDVKSYIRKFDNIKGAVSVNANVLPGGYKANIKVYELQAKYLPWNVALSINEGKIIASPDKVYFNNVYGKASKSSVFLNGSFYNYLSNPEMNIIADAKLNSDDINEYISPRFKNQLITKGIIPASAIIKGSSDQWKVIAQLTLNKGANISFQNDIQLPEDKTRIFSLDATGTKSKIDINNMEIALSNGATNTNIEHILNIKGIINKINTESPYFNKLSVIASNPINITLFNRALKSFSSEPVFGDGQIKGNIVLNGKVSSPQVLGDVSLYNVTIPSKELTINNSDITLDEMNITLSNSNINLGGSDAAINAVIANVFDYPVLVKNINIDSPSLNIDKISKIFNNNTSEESDLPLFVVTNGSLHAQELIISDLITYNVLSKFTFTPDWLLSLTDTSLITAGGIAKGEVLYNLKSTDIAANISAINMQANAAATTLLKLPNEVYGTLNGRGVFNSRGKNSQEIIANANGFADFVITDGRLVRLGSLEYFLRALNLVQGGVAEFNLNNILDLVIPKNTGNFETLKGSLAIKDGVIRTDNLSSIGKDLSLYLSGNIDMVNNNADMTILGNMSKKISGLLGPLGSVSINTFIDFIPGIGFIPSTPETGLINMIPGLSKIPGLGLGGSKKVRRFEVKINGNLYDPTSVKSFRWLD